jgi:hypothetical protein
VAETRGGRMKKIKNKKEFLMQMYKGERIA